MATGDMSFIFGGDTGDTPETLKRKRAIAEALAAYTAPKNVGEGIGAIARGLAAGVMNNRANSAEKAGRESATSAFSSVVGALSRPPSSSPANLPTPEAAAEIEKTSPNVAAGPSSVPTSLLAAVDNTEGAGAYDTLYGHAQRKGPLAGTDVSKMSVGEALAFADPSGPYGQQVKSQIGRVATPMGRYQIVGTTLKNAVAKLGIDPSTPFDANTQDTIATYLAKQRVASADTVDGKIAALRNEWEGLRKVPRDQMVQIISDLEAGGSMASAAAPSASPQEVASLDPSIGMPEAAAQVAATQPGYRDAAVVAPNAQPQQPMQQAPEVAALPEPREVSTPPVPPNAVPVAPTGQRAPSSEVVQALTPPQTGPGMNDLMKLAQNPWLTDNQSGVVNALIKGQISQQQAERELQLQRSDPKYQLEIQKMRAEAEALRNPERKTVIINNRLVDARTGEQIANYASPDAPKAPNLETLFDDQGREYKAEWDAKTGTWKQVGGAKMPSGMSLRTNPDGSVELTQGAGGGKGFTEGQSKDNVYATRAKGSLEVADQYADYLADFGDQLMDADPTGVIRGNFQDKNYQVARTAADEFLQAILRKDTGAAITKPEQELYGKTYFPVPGDGPEVRAYKKEARVRAIAAIESGMSPAQLIAKEQAIAKAAGISGIGPPDAKGKGSAPGDAEKEVPQPEGVDADVWGIMTPEERKLWQK